MKDLIALGYAQGATDAVKKMEPMLVEAIHGGIMTALTHERALLRPFLVDLVKVVIEHRRGCPDGCSVCAVYERVPAELLAAAGG